MMLKRSAAETTTDEDGTARTVVTLDSAPGVVRVPAKLFGFEMPERAAVT